MTMPRHLRPTPRKRGMARAIEIVERMQAISESYAAEYDTKNPLAAEAFRTQVAIYTLVIQQLRSEAR